MLDANATTRIEWVRFETQDSRGIRKVTVITLPQAPLKPKRRGRKPGMVTSGNRPDYRKKRVAVDGEVLAPVAGQPGRLGIPNDPPRKQRRGQGRGLRRKHLQPTQ